MSTTPQVETVTEEQRSWARDAMGCSGSRDDALDVDTFAILSAGFPGSTATTIPELASVAKRRGEELTNNLRDAGDELATIKRAVFGNDLLNWNHPTEYVLNRITNLRAADAKVESSIKQTESLASEVAYWKSRAESKEAELDAICRDRIEETEQLANLEETHMRCDAQADIQAALHATTIERNDTLSVELAEAEKRCSDLTRLVEDGSREIARMAAQRDAAVEASNRDLEMRRQAGEQLGKFMRQLAGMVGHSEHGPQSIGMPDSTAVFTRLARLVEEHGRATKQEATELSDKRSSLRVLREEKELALAERDEAIKERDSAQRSLEAAERLLRAAVIERDDLLEEMANSPADEDMIAAVDRVSTETPVVDSIPGDDLVEDVIQRAAEIVAAHIIDTRGR